MSTDIYDFRKTAEGMAIENINEFKKSYSDRHDGVELTSMEIHSALKDRVDVRDFSMGGQAKNIHMLAAECQRRLAAGRIRIRALLLTPVATSNMPSTSTSDTTFTVDSLIDSLIPPLTDDEFYGYRRPNIHYRGGEAVDELAALAVADAKISHLFGYMRIPLCSSYIKKPKGHVSQFLRSIVAASYQCLDPDVAMKHWVKHTSLLVPDAPPDLTGSKKVRSDGRVRQDWTEEQQQTVIQALRRIQTFFGELSWDTLLRYLVEPIPQGVRDYFRTIVCLSIGTALGFSTPSEAVVKGIAEALRKDTFLDLCSSDYSAFAPRTNHAQSAILEEILQENGSISVDLYWKVCARLASTAPVRPCPGMRAVAIIKKWKRKRERFPRLQSGTFTIMDIELCDEYWLAGWPIYTMTTNIARILGRNHEWVKERMAAFAHRWTYDENGDRVVDNKLKL